jgi:hypothetical protein
VRRLVIDVDCEEKECGVCEYLKTSEPPSPFFLRCDLFNRLLDHRLADDPKKIIANILASQKDRESKDVIGIRCRICRRFEEKEK